MVEFLVAVFLTGGGLVVAYREGYRRGYKNGKFDGLLKARPRPHKKKEAY